MVVGMDFGLIGRTESVVAMRTGGERGLDDLVRVLDQRGRPRRGGFSAESGRFALCPFEGGRLELSGVLGRVASLASSPTMRAVRTLICSAYASTCACGARIKAISSSRDRARRPTWLTPLRELTRPRPYR